MDLARADQSGSSIRQRVSCRSLLFSRHLSPFPATLLVFRQSSYLIHERGLVTDDQLPAATVLPVAERSRFPRRCSLSRQITLGSQGRALTFAKFRKEIFLFFTQQAQSRTRDRSWPGYESLALAFCFATSRCMNLDPSQEDVAVSNPITARSLVEKGSVELWKTAMAEPGRRGLPPLRWGERPSGGVAGSLYPKWDRAF